VLKTADVSNLRHVGGFLPEIMLKVALNTKTHTQNSRRV